MIMYFIERFPWCQKKPKTQKCERTLYRNLLFLKVTTPVRFINEISFYYISLSYLK